MCLIIYHNYTERKEWINFRNSLSVDSDFLCSNSFEKEFPMEKTDDPVVYLESNIELKKVITTHEINAIENPQELVLVKEKLKV